MERVYKNRELWLMAKKWNLKNTQINILKILLKKKEMALAQLLLEDQLNIKRKKENYQRKKDK